MKPRLKLALTLASAITLGGCVQPCPPGDDACIQQRREMAIMMLGAMAQQQAAQQAQQQQEQIIQNAVGNELNRTTIWVDPNNGSASFSAPQY